jgi:ring-1,2-phenylacetyl-CoA epoxidase subunit PaaC
MARVIFVRHAPTPETGRVLTGRRPGVGLDETGIAIAGAARDALREAWLAEIASVFGDAGLQAPAESAFRSTGTLGIHTEHMGRILSEMQHLQRAYPGGAW